MSRKEDHTGRQAELFPVQPADEGSAIFEQDLSSVPDAELVLTKAFLDHAGSAAYLQTLREQVEWCAGEITLYGKRHSVPRLQSWIGDPGCEYGYSGILLQPAPFPPAMTELRARLSEQTGIDFNCVLANLYRDGNDSVGWHADDEPELGPRPIVASLSLGATRRFRMRHKVRSDLDPLSFDLEAGDLLLMQGATQDHWEHQLTKTKREVAERINLTFRRIGL
ncbi:MAG: alkylated DNA repair dioxygenase AlkB [Planctomycetota bacterium]|jgi:alkylated DNA repair dioxygenase AlkB